MLYSVYSFFVLLNATNSADECNLWDVPDRHDGAVGRMDNPPPRAIQQIQLICL